MQGFFQKLPCCSQFWQEFYKLQTNFICFTVKIVTKPSLIEKHRNSFPSAPTVFVGVKIVGQINLRFLSFRLASAGGPKLKTVAVNVERQRRKIYRQLWRFEVRRYFSKIWAVYYRRKFPTERLQSLLFFQETPVTVAKISRNAGNRRFFVQNTGGFTFFPADPPLS